MTPARVAPGRMAGLIAVLLIIACTAPSASLAYAIQTQRYDASLAGRVNTAVNLLVFLGAFAAQWGVGAILDLWPSDGGVHPPAAYAAAFGVLAAAETIALARLYLADPGAA